MNGYPDTLELYRERSRTQTMSVLFFVLFCFVLLFLHKG